MLAILRVFVKYFTVADSSCDDLSRVLIRKLWLGQHQLPLACFGTLLNKIKSNVTG